ncbi:hypothetical protein EZV62_001023 [Acer yangbiense]|uniref:DUF4283 domain-containing protein n=1 Tax=Acer yangbiense TaxID=1000413 RepID=A0A5C7IUB2_9ROSI|nr:hypothetical protein EZV62_001023 [Acer yangbiense]
MNEIEIASLCNALSIEEKESPAKILDVNLKDRGEQRLALCLVGKVLASKVVNMDTFRDVMKRIWRVNRGVEIEPVEDNIFEFQFKNLEARQRILSGGPWRFNRAIIIFEKPTRTGEIANMEFNRTEFWVQIRNFTYTVYVGRNRSILRSLRVDLLEDGKITTILLRYERVLDFCYKCNRLVLLYGSALFWGIIGKLQPKQILGYVCGYGFSGPREATRSQEYWRYKKQSPEADGGRKGIIWVVGEKENLGTLASKSSGPDVADQMDILKNHEEIGMLSGVESEILNNDLVMGSEEGLGLDR